MPQPADQQSSESSEPLVSEVAIPRNPSELDASFEEFERFDWEDFAKKGASTPQEVQANLETQRAVLQSWMASRFMPGCLEILVKEVPVNTLWFWFSQKENLSQRAQLLRGFQQTPQILRNPAVRTRLIRFFEKEHHLRVVVLLLWGQKEQPHPLVALLDGEPADAAVMKRLPTIFKEFEPAVLMCAAAYCCRPLLFKRVYDFMVSPTEFFDQVATVEATAAELADVDALDSDGEVSPDQPMAETVSDEAYVTRGIELETAREEMARLSAHNEIVVTQNKALQKEISVLKAHEKQIVTQWEKKFELGLKKAQAEIAELKRHDERQTRRLNKTERERDELETLLRKTKKQLRNAQQLLETERKNLSLLNLKAADESDEEVRATTPTSIPASAPVNRGEAPTSPVKTVPASPLDEIFEWQADGRRIAISPRQVRKFIDQNDEDELYKVLLALEVLQTKNRELYNRFLHRLGTIAASYKRVLTSPTQRVLVDASNVARSQTVKGRGMLKLLLSARDELRGHGAWPIILVADASLRHNIDEGKRFQEMIDSGEVIQSDKGVEADEILAREARRTGASVVTNDARFFHKVSPDFEPPRIPFRVFDGTVLVDEI